MNEFVSRSRGNLTCHKLIKHKQTDISQKLKAKTNVCLSQNNRDLEKIEEKVTFFVEFVHHFVNHRINNNYSAMGSSYSALSNLDDDAMLAQSDNLGTPRLFSPRKQPILRPAVHTESINWLSPVRPEMVISGSSDKTIALNNMDTGACLTRWRGHEREVTKVVYKHIECRHFLLSGSKDCTVRLWHFNSSECCQLFAGHQMAVTGLAALDEASFVSGGRDGKLFIWDLERNRPIRTVGSSQNLVTHIESDQEGKILYQTAEDGCLRVWDAKNLSPIDQLPSDSNHAQWHCSLSPFIPSFIMTAGGGTLGDGCQIGLWDIRQRKMVQQFRGHESDVRSAIFLHQQQVTWKRLLLSVSADRTAKLWDMNSGRCVWTEAIPVELNSCVGFSDGSMVIGGGKATLCELRLLVKAGRPFLNCSSLQQSIGEEANK